MRKLRNDGRMIRIDDRLGRLRAELARIDGLAAAYLFGSYGTADQTPLSDVDLALVFAPGEAPTFNRELELIALVTGALAEDDVSVTVLDRAPCAFQHRVLATGRCLLLRDRIALAEFTEQVIDRYCDFAIDRRRFLDEYDAALRERYRAA